MHRVPSFSRWWLFALVLFIMRNPLEAAQERALRQGEGRIIFVGDSITGQGRGWVGTGYCYQLEWALAQVYPEAKPQIIALGGSGMGVGSWAGVEKRSRTEERTLDVKDLPVKENLSQPADALVIMLGMNDALAPYISATDEGIEKWIGQYRALATALRERVNPRVTAFGTITPYTETRRSFKNRQITRMNEALARLAKEMGAVMLPTGEACWEVLALGRERLPDFLVTRDYVHPNLIGNQAIAIGMLRGLGEEEAADRLLKERVLPAIASKAEGKSPISYTLEALDTPGSFEVHYWWNGEDAATAPVQAKLLLPKGWRVEPEVHPGRTGRFKVEGTPEQLLTALELEITQGAARHARTLEIPAPWLVSAGLKQPWENNPHRFTLRAPTNAVDEAIAAGRDFTHPELIPAPGAAALNWSVHYANVGLTGGADPGSVDYAAISDGQTFEGGYAARWIESERARPVVLELATNGFATHIHLTVWLNGEVIYEDDLSEALKKTSDKKVRVETRLREGENTLVIRSNHPNWQWQYVANLRGVAGDDLGDLRYRLKVPASR